MTVRYDPEFLQMLKKLDVRIRKNFKASITLFVQDPFNPALRNHALQREYADLRSIDVTNDYRALYIEKQEKDETVAYFVAIGTHKELYG